MTSTDTIHAISRSTDELTPRYSTRWEAFRAACKLHGVRGSETESTAAAAPEVPEIVRIAERRAKAFAATREAHGSPEGQLENSPLAKACKRLGAK
jgi:hypothetical protein